MPDNVIPFPRRDEPTPATTRRRPRPEKPATYRLRVALDLVEPEIWREVEVDSTLTLDRLHTVLQLALGWTDSHLHQWIPYAPDDYEGWPPERFVMDPTEEEFEPATAEASVHLDELLQQPGDRIWYEYDFGDGWNHTVTLTDVLPGTAPSARLVAAAGACPPEDIGGPYFYQELLELSQGRGQDADEWMREVFQQTWPSGIIDQSVDIEAINEVLATNPPSVLETAEPWRRGLRPEVLDIVDRLAMGPLGAPTKQILKQAIADARPVDPAMAEGATEQIRWLLDYVGDGLALTSAKYLKPADVEAIAAAWDLSKTWIGKLNREIETIPILHAREALQHYGLLRSAKGRVTLTKAATKVKDDPVALWNHLVAKVPGRAKGFESDASFAYLFALAADADHPLDQAAETMKALGWRSSTGRYDGFSVLHDASDLVVIIERLEWQMDGKFGRRSHATHIGRAFAAAVIAGS